MTLFATIAPRTLGQAEMPAATGWRLRTEIAELGLWIYRDFNRQIGNKSAIGNHQFQSAIANPHSTIDMLRRCTSTSTPRA